MNKFEKYGHIDDNIETLRSRGRGDSSREEYEKAQQGHRAQTEQEEQLNKEAKSGNFASKMAAKARLFYRNIISLEGPKYTAPNLKRLESLADEEARVLENQHEVLQNKVERALKELRDFEVNKLGMESRNRKVIEK